MKKSSRTNWIYLVYANPEHPLVYAIFSNKKSALKYANQLIRYRIDRAIERKWEYGYYHYTTEDKREDEFSQREKYIFSACLKIKDESKYFSDDGCLIQVIRRPLLK